MKRIKSYVRRLAVLVEIFSPYPKSMPLRRAAKMAAKLMSGSAMERALPDSYKALGKGATWNTNYYEYALIDFRERIVNGDANYMRAMNYDLDKMTCSRQLLRQYIEYARCLSAAISAGTDFPEGKIRPHVERIVREQTIWPMGEKNPDFGPPPQPRPVKSTRMRRVDYLDDPFDIDPALLKRDTMDYNWKIMESSGKQMPQYVARALRDGWTPAPAAEHPAITTQVLDGRIIFNGMLLMWREKSVSRAAEIEQFEMAQQQLQTTLGNPPDVGQGGAKIKKNGIAKDKK